MCIIPYYIPNWQLPKYSINIIIPHVWIIQYLRIIPFIMLK